MNNPFFILGAAKAGTTSLCEYLSLHPDICISKPKETNFFDTDQYDKGVNFYKDQYFGHIKDGQVWGEGTPNYLHVPYVAKRIKGAFPEAKLIMIFRNPVERCFSHWWMFYSRNREKLDFEDAIQDNFMRIRSGLDLKGPDGKSRWNDVIKNILCYEKGIAQYRTYLDQGYYGEQLARYLKYFPSHQLQCLFFEDFCCDLKGVLRNICKFIGVDANYQFPELKPHNVAFNSRIVRTFVSRISGTGAKCIYNKFVPDSIKGRVLNSLAGIGHKPKMNERTKKQLIEHYSCHNKELEKLTGRDLSAWDR